MRFSTLLAPLAFAAGAVASAIYKNETNMDSAASYGKVTKGCPNTPQSRGCWGDGWSIENDPHEEWPHTGRTVKYTLRIQNVTMAPDGYERMMLVVNGQYPGPTIEANWGDDLEITVINELAINGTGIHFHGIRQVSTNYADGAVSETQCPIAPGDSYTYKFKATQHGTSWYHSHMQIQYSDGVVGPIVIHGPKTANYDIDLGPVLLTDWYHQTATHLSQEFYNKRLSIPPIAANGLINGQNVNSDKKHGGPGRRFETTFTPGKKHLLRLVNTGIGATTFKFSIDKHKFTVVAMDFVPIQPYVTDKLFISIGQRYDIIIDADQKPDNYWLRAVQMQTCLFFNEQAHHIRGIVRYKDTNSNTDPQTLPHTILDLCAAEPLANTIPYHPHTVGPPALQETFNFLLLAEKHNNDYYALRWQSPADSDSPYLPHMSPPSNQQVFYTPRKQVDPRHVPWEVPLRNKWVYMVIQSQLPLPHPMHLHGHDMYTLARGFGKYIPGLHKLNTVNPPRRDTVLLPQSGFIVVAFYTDNPGVWLFHCHIEWHLHHGLALTVVERREDLRRVLRKEIKEVDRVCGNWEKSGLGNGFI